MIYSVHIPIRGPQAYYAKAVQSLEAQTCKDFELIICEDNSNTKHVLKPIATSFPQRIVQITSRLPGWAYGVARNVCLDFASRTSDYLVHCDVDWILRPVSLEKCKLGLSPDRIIQGYKYYVGPGRKRHQTRFFPELCIIPLDAAILCGGWDEIFFPWYAGDYHDLMRRLQLIRKLELIKTKALFADDIGSSVEFDKVYDVGKQLVDKLKDMGTKQSIVRRTVPCKIVYEKGF